MEQLASTTPEYIERQHLCAWEYALPAGELGISACQTVLVALLPMLLVRQGVQSSASIGFVVGGEGMFALALPWLAGRALDRLPASAARRLGRHGVFLTIAAPIMVVALCSLPLLSDYWTTTTAAFAFFAALQAYQTPLITLIVDTLPDARRARVQGVRSVYRACGLSFGLAGGGFLFAVAPALPFAIAAALLVASTAATLWARRHAPPERPVASQSTRSLLRRVRNNRPAMWLLIANALWNGAIDGVRPYVFVFTTTVLGMSISASSSGLSALVAMLAMSSLFFGKLGDSRDRMRLLQIGLLFVGVAFAAGYFVRSPAPALLIVALAGIGAGALITLPYPLFAQLMGTRATGQYSGLFVASVSVGRLGAPILVGAVIDLGSELWPEIKPYRLLWPTAGVLALLGGLSLWRARRVMQ